MYEREATFDKQGDQADYLLWREDRPHLLARIKAQRSRPMKARSSVCASVCVRAKRVDRRQAGGDTTLSRREWTSTPTRLSHTEDKHVSDPVWSETSPRRVETLLPREAEKGKERRCVCVSHSSWGRLARRRKGGRPAQVQEMQVLGGSGISEYRTECVVVCAVVRRALTEGGSG